MKLQIQQQTLRLRIDESELATLLNENVPVSTLRLPNGESFVQSLSLVMTEIPSLQTHGLNWYFNLPRTIVEAYVELLPCREGLTFILGNADNLPLTVQFEVDVRDSVKQRGSNRKTP